MDGRMNEWTHERIKQLMKSNYNASFGCVLFYFVLVQVFRYKRRSEPFLRFMNILNIYRGCHINLILWFHNRRVHFAERTGVDFTRVIDLLFPLNVTVVPRLFLGIILRLLTTIFRRK